jgi:hypothetical protein
MIILSVLPGLFLSASLTVSIAFVPGPAALGHSTLVANPNTASADGTTALVLTFTARDNYDNLIPGLGVSLTASGTSNTLGAASGTTDANGQFATTLSSTVAQSEIVTADVGNGTTASAQVTFVPGSPSAAASSFAVNPNRTTADNSNTLVAVLTLRDAQGNAIAGTTPSFSASGANTTVLSSGSTSSSGQASASYRSALAQNENALVTASNLTWSVPIAFVVGPVAAVTSTLVASPSIAAGDGTATISLVATARDAQGNCVPGASITLSASGGNTTFNATSGTTLADGTFTTSLGSTQMQNETITATFAGNVIETAVVTFTGSPNTVTSTLVASPNSQTVGPSNVIYATVTLRDAASNPLAGVTPNWSASGLKTTIAPSGPTSSSGVATAAYTSTMAQNENVRVSAVNASLYTPVRFVAGSPNMVTSYLNATPTRQLANNSNTVTASLMLRDAYSNVVSGQTATFSASGSNTVVSGAVTTDSTGLAQATYRTSTVQNQNALAVAGGLSLATPIIFTGVPAQCILSVSPSSQPADGNSPLALTATVTDNSNQPVSDIQVVFSSTGAAQAFSTQNAITTLLGLASSNLTSLYAGNNTLLAQAANVQCTNQGAFSTRTPYCPGNPNYSVKSYAASGSPYGVAASDFDGDGNLDLVVTNYYSNNIGVFLGTRTGAFQTQVVYATGHRPYAVMTGDFNSDGKQDLAITNNLDSTLSVLLGTGMGTFQSQATYATGGNPQGLAIGDFDADGKQDLAVVNSYDNTLSIFFGTGTGQFKTQLIYPTGSRPSNLTVGDFNGDGKQDLAAMLLG